MTTAMVVGPYHHSPPLRRGLDPGANQAAG